MSEPRYIVAESSGYPIAQGQTAGNQALVTEVMVLDRAYCHKVVWSSLTTVMRVERSYPRLGKRGQPIARKRNAWNGTAWRWPLEQRREYARELAAQLNAEDEAAC